MVCSAGYHMFHCQSDLATRRWLSLDLAGVSVGLCGCYFPGAYYAFYCNVVSLMESQCCHFSQGVQGYQQGYNSLAHEIEELLISGDNCFAVSSNVGIEHDS